MLIEERRTISPRGLVMGATIGLASGLLLDYLALFGLKLLNLPAPDTTFPQLLGSAWFIPLIVAGTVLGALYYASES